MAPILEKRANRSDETNDQQDQLVQADAASKGLGHRKADECEKRGLDVASQSMEDANSC